MEEENLSDVSMKQPDDTIIKLRNYAVELKKAGHAFYNFDGQNLSAEQRHKAMQLHYFATVLLVSSDDNLLFKVDNAKNLVASGYSYEDFVDKVKEYDRPDKCNVIWDELAVAYRCYTCGLNPCMSICVHCFEAGDHKGHDCNRFFSSSGGKCDCGDKEVVLESGFCNKHGKCNNSPIDVPYELFALVEFMMVKMSMKLLEKFRGYSHRASPLLESRQNSTKCISEFIAQKIVTEVEPFIIFLDELISLSAPCIDIMVKLLCSFEFYSSIRDYDRSKSMPEDSVITIEEMSLVNAKATELLGDVASLNDYSIPKNLESNEFLPQEKLTFECLLDELMFYQVRMGFPQLLINFLLKLLPNDDFKNQFACNFFKHYDLIERLLFEIANENRPPTDTHILSKVVSRVVHISVQICSSRAMCVMLQEKINIMRRVLESCLRMVFNNSTKLKFDQDDEASTLNWNILSMDRNVFFENFGYYGATTDLQNLFAHQDLIDLIFKDVVVTEEFVLLLSSMEGMNVMKRIVYGDHIAMDISNSQRFFTFEMEISNVFINQTLNNTSNHPAQALFTAHLIEKLKEFFCDVFTGSVQKVLSSVYATFHIPLHRQLASACMKHFVINKSLDGILSDDTDFLQALVVNPLRIQAVISEYFAGMWTRNGSIVNTNVVLYLQSTFRHFIDNDLALIRIVTTKLKAFALTRLISDAFHVDDCYEYCCSEHDGETAPVNVTVFHKKWVPFMLDGYLKLLLELTFVRTLTELSTEEEVRLQIIHVLTAIDKTTYSRIRQYFQYIQQIDDSMFERILNDVATFVKPNTLGPFNQQGHYLLKKHYWTDAVDLVQAKYRSMGPREFNTIVLRQEKELIKLSDKFNDRKPWPLYCLSDFKRDDLIFVKALHVLLQPSNIFVCRFIIESYLNSDLPIHLLQQAIFLLNLIVKITTLEFMKTAEIEFSNYDKDDTSFVSTLEQKQVEYFKYFNQRPERALYIGALATDSILMLLLKLYYNLYSTEFPNSNKTQAAQTLETICNKDLSTMDRFIGSGTDYVGRLIAWLYQSDPVSERIVKDEVFSLSLATNESSSYNQKLLLEKKMAAKKRQLELLNQQKAKQSALMKKFVDEEGYDDSISAMDCDKPDESKPICSICNDACEDREWNFFGILVYSQTGSVLEDSITASSNNLTIGEYVMDIERPLEGSLLASYQDFENEAISLFCQKYVDSSMFALMPYFEFKTCAHYVHLSCYKTYKDTIMTDEYSNHGLNALTCPLCRTNINYILPLAPKLDKILRSIEVNENIFFTEPQIALIIQQHLNFELLVSTSMSDDSLEYYNKLKKKILKLVNIRETLRVKESKHALNVVQNVIEKSPPMLPLSLIRNYIDRMTVIEQNGYDFPRRLKGVLAEHLYFLACFESNAPDNCGQMFCTFWNKIVGKTCSNHYFDVTMLNLIPPLLHYDSQTLLVICSASLTIFSLTKTSRLAFFRLCAKITLVHCFVRTVVITLLKKPVEKHSTIMEELANDCNVQGLSSMYLKLKIALENLGSWHSDRICGGFDVSAQTINELVQRNLLKFLQFAFNLAAELQLLSDVKVAKQDKTNFDELLGQQLEKMFDSQTRLINIFTMVDEESRVSNWMSDFANSLDYAHPYYVEDWNLKMLRPLPDSFDTLFKVYFGQKCLECDTVPIQPLICLVCGRLLCLDVCCEEALFESPARITEVEKHANNCCSGSAVFFSISSTMIVLYHRGYVSLFQSPYLDTHFEEDRNLRRGKSLFLSKPRYERLEQLWIMRDFERNWTGSRTWLPIENLSELLRQSHNFV